jgi:hypothetical protein
MLSAIIEIGIAAVLAWLLWRFVSRLLNPSQPAESEPGNYAGTPAKLRPRPKLGAGAVALAEPDDDEEPSARV